ncbi:hypothetical protein MKZ38_004989 [Zalerion maritima]|uniref:Ras-associating domain-containing protein n=1 Tax=Zalerion maritima TaxID=339359 RepID=A0AAD5RLP8_9PEZI|nr:hypothetical protein MKZ38_004989 [Zalerion maritima]
MAELAASIIGIVSAGTKVAYVLSSIGSNIGSAGKEARIMAQEIRSFCTILHHIEIVMSKRIQQSSGHFSHCSEILEDMTIVSQCMFKEIVDIVDHTQTMADESGLALGKVALGARLKWVFNRPKFLFLRSALEAYKADMSLMLEVMQAAQSLRYWTSDTQPPEAPTIDGGSAVFKKLRSPDMRSKTGMKSRSQLESAEEQTSIPGVVDMIESLREEVSTLGSRASSMYATSEVGSGDSGPHNPVIISLNLSKHSSRLSSLIDTRAISRRASSISAVGSLARYSSFMARQSSILPTYRQSLVPRPTGSTEESRSRVDGLAGPAPNPAPDPAEYLETIVAARVQSLPLSETAHAEDALKLLQQSLERAQASVPSGLDSARWISTVIKDLAFTPESQQMQYLSTLLGSLPPESEDDAEPDGSAAVKISKSFRLSMDDATYKVLPAALMKYHITAPWDQYTLSIAYGDENRTLGLDEKPMLVFKELDKQGKKPMFMLRKNNDNSIYNFIWCRRGSRGERWDGIWSTYFFRQDVFFAVEESGVLEPGMVRMLCRSSNKEFPWTVLGCLFLKAAVVLGKARP